MANRADKGDVMLTHGIDQDEEAAFAYYSGLNRLDRGELAMWISGKNGELDGAPQWVLDAVKLFAAISFMRIGQRWGRENSE